MDPLYLTYEECLDRFPTESRLTDRNIDPEHKIEMLNVVAETKISYNIGTGKKIDILPLIIKSQNRRDGMYVNCGTLVSIFREFS